MHYCGTLYVQLAEFNLEIEGGFPTRAALATHPHQPYVAVAAGERLVLLKAQGAGHPQEMKRPSWIKVAEATFKGLIAITTVAWEADGCGLCLGSVRGSVERMRVFLRRLKCPLVHELGVTLSNQVGALVNEDAPCI